MGIMHRKRVKKVLREKENNPKTFKSEELANKWAKDNGIEKFKLVDLRRLGSTDKKIKVVAE